MIPLLGENLADWLGDNAWAIWFTLTVLLAIAEMLSLDFVLVMLAAGALAGGITALIVPGLWWLQIIVAVVVSVITLLTLRPTLLRRVRNLPGYKGSFATMVGRTGRATQEITADGGVIKVDGQEWTAKAYDPDLVIPAGARVEVFELDGAVAMVYPADQPLDRMRELEQDPAWNEGPALTTGAAAPAGPAPIDPGDEHDPADLEPEQDSKDQEK